MKNLFCWFLMVLHLQSILAAENCEESSDVFAVVGEELTLQVSVVETKRIKKMAWVNSQAVKFTTSYTNGSVEIWDNSYTKRLRASGDGSIILKILTDDRTITATIYLLDGEDCSQTYNLRITDRCSATKNVSARAGGTITLQVEESPTGNLSWERPVGVHVATTRPGGYINVQARQYYGRLLGSHDDGSLTITDLSPQDQGDYRAIMSPRDGVSCAQTYNVYISDKSSDLKSGVGFFVITGVVLGIATLLH